MGNTHKKDILQKKLELLTQKNKNSNLNEEILISCQTCNNPFFIWKEADYFNCLTCRQQFCVKCNENWLEHKNKICEQDIDFPKEKKCPQFQKNTANNNNIEKFFPDDYNEASVHLLNDNDDNLIKKENNLSNDEKIQILIKENKWQNCPECGSIVEKTAYCNFIICNSSLCQRKVMFCYLCGNQLNEQSKKEHFIDDNIYANDCINTLMEKTEKKLEFNVLIDNSNRVSSVKRNQNKGSCICQTIINVVTGCFSCMVECMKKLIRRNDSSGKIK